ncbi:MAG: pantoate--beta-alanine ligase [Candidatus Omnitrophica bacterium]|nr:pantoate--beta-alanine ligase [Candidatus Omnitrophota bacterium]
MVIKTIAQLRKIVAIQRKKGKRIGFVPTMGCFHKGHLSLMRYARKENDVVIVSIFVNPTQFGPEEDYRQYPRNLKKDCQDARGEKVDYIFCPSLDDMYPSPFLSSIKIGKLSELLCGVSRPGHFQGVATVVCKLFNSVLPDYAYFGQKDYQQFLIIQQMVRDLNIPVQLKVCPIVREDDGLAMSSRNVYLNQQERVRALSLYQSLSVARTCIKAGEKDPQAIISQMKKKIEEQVDKIDYIAILGAENFDYVETIQGKLFVGVAAYVGKTRLIDNIIVSDDTF